MQNKILFLVIESNNNNINNNNNNISVPRLFEDEAIKCCEHWRKNSGYLKDIDIICFAPTKNTPSLETINKLKKLNVIYIEEYLEISEKLEWGFFLVPYVGKIIEERFPDSYLIHIDLDMNIIQPLDSSFFNENIYIGQYDDVSSLTQRDSKKNNWRNPLDTGFTISPPGSNFYLIFSDLFSDYYFNKKYITDKKWINQDADNGTCFLEEFIADKIYNEEILKVKTIQHYQIGEGYSSVKNLTDEQIVKIYFWHEHIYIDPLSFYNEDRFMQKIYFNKKIRELKNGL
jgi:hypothetical protein